MAITNDDWILALETCVTDATLVLAKGSEIQAEKSFQSERSQECDLFGPLQDILNQLPEGESLNTIVVGTGPGSYNGARVGIAAAQAMAQVHQCRVAGLCSFEGVPEIAENETVWAIGDARRGSFFLMPIRKSQAETPPRLLEEDVFLAELSRCDGPKVTFESPDRLPKGVDCRESQSHARGLLRSWLARSGEEQANLLRIPTEAFYLRPPHITKSKKELKL